MLPDIKIKIGEGLKGFNGMIDVLLEQMISEQESPATELTPEQATRNLEIYVVMNVFKKTKKNKDKPSTAKPATPNPITVPPPNET